MAMLRFLEKTLTIYAVCFVVDQCFGLENVCARISSSDGILVLACGMNDDSCRDNLPTLFPDYDDINDSNRANVPIG